MRSSPAISAFFSFPTVLQSPFLFSWLLFLCPWSVFFCDHPSLFFYSVFLLRFFLPLRPFVFPASQKATLFCWSSSDPHLVDLPNQDLFLVRQFCPPLFFVFCCLFFLFPPPPDSGLEGLLACPNPASCSADGFCPSYFLYPLQRMFSDLFFRCFKLPVFPSTVALQSVLLSFFVMCSFAVSFCFPLVLLPRASRFFRPGCFQVLFFLFLTVGPVLNGSFVAPVCVVPR